MRPAAGLASPLRGKALIFDMDGTLLLSDAVIARIWRRWTAAHGLDFATLVRVSHGRRMVDVVSEFCPPGISAPEEAARLEAEERGDVDGILPVEGVLAFLKLLPPDKWAVVTSADRELARIRMQAAGIEPPALVIASEDVSRGKPDPEGYLAAIRQLGVAPAETIVFEDAPAGIAAAHAAGAQVVIMTTAPHLGDEHVGHRVPDYARLRATLTDDGWIELSSSPA